MARRNIIIVHEHDRQKAPIVSMNMEHDHSASGKLLTFNADILPFTYKQKHSPCCLIKARRMDKVKTIKKTVESGTYDLPRSMDLDNSDEIVLLAQLKKVIESGFARLFIAN